MNNDFYGLTIFILTILLGIRQLITSCRIDNLYKRIEKLEKEIKELEEQMNKYLVPCTEMVKEGKE